MLISIARSLGFDAEKLDIEDQIAIGRNITRGAFGPVGEFARDCESSHATDFHARHAIGPPFNNLVEAKGDGFAEIVAALKNNAVFAERTGVMNGDRAAACRFDARSYLEIFDEKLWH